MARRFAAQERYRERQTDKRGMVRLSVWVPAEAREKVLALCARLRKVKRDASE